MRSFASRTTRWRSSRVSGAPAASRSVKRGASPHRREPRTVMFPGNLSSSCGGYLIAAGSREQRARCHRADTCAHQMLGRLSVESDGSLPLSRASVMNGQPLPSAMTGWLSADDWDALGRVSEPWPVVLLDRCSLGIVSWVVRCVESNLNADHLTVCLRTKSPQHRPAPTRLLSESVTGSSSASFRPPPIGRKNIISFDFRDHDGRPMPLLGLREEPGARSLS